jgi:ribose transport system permease protein
MSEHVAAARKAHGLFHLISSQALLLLTVGLVIVFSLIMPRTFPTLLTVQSILSDKAIIAFLALAEMAVISCAQFDLSVGFNVSLLHSLAVGLVVDNNLPWPLVFLIVIALGVGLGVVNGLLVRVAKIDSFIATLGVGTISYGLAGWYTGGQQIIGNLPYGFTALDQIRVLGVPFSALLLLAIAVAMWIVFEFLPIGRYLYVIGANERTAELTGIRVNRYVMATFMVSGLLTAIASLALAARIQVGQSNVGQEFLLPAFVGALLGATTVKPGRVNVWGTLVAVLILAVGISGIEQLGGAFYVESLFNGGALIVAVGMAGWASRRRLRASRDGKAAARMLADTAAKQPASSKTT